MVTTLGSGESGGSVCIVNLTEPLDFRSSSHYLRRRTSKIGSFHSTIWTADCSRTGTHAVVGTNDGVAWIDLETRASSWVYRSKSDVLSQQFGHSESVVLCGLRNGAIIEVDVRERRSCFAEVSSRSTATPIVRRTSHALRVRHEKRSKQRFESTGASTSYSHPFMPSAVCSLIALRSDENYFLGSSMDGSIKLFDRRFLQRGAIQSYEGHVNSHSHLQLGVNPSETLVLSGGEDHFVRVWSIKAGELIFEENVSSSILATVCWSQGARGLLRPARYREESPFESSHSWGAWLGSPEGLFYMHGA